MIKKLKHITTICYELYKEKGASAVYDYCNEYMEKNPNSNIKYKNCKGCEADTPHWYNECLVCGEVNEVETEIGIM